MAKINTKDRIIIPIYCNDKSLELHRKYKQNRKMIINKVTLIIVILFLTLFLPIWIKITKESEVQKSATIDIRK